MSSQDPQTFRLLDLPPELRNLIYEYVFEGTHTKIYSRLGSRETSKRWARTETVPLTRFLFTLPNGDSNFKVPALFATNRQIRSEAIGVFYATTTWVVCSEFELSALLRRIGHERLPLVTRISYKLIRPLLPWSRSEQDIGKAILKILLAVLSRYDEGVNPSILRVEVHNGRTMVWSSD